MKQEKQKNNLILITGMSGAGQTTALKHMEDMGYETIDNLPLFILEELVEATFKKDSKPLCIGLGVRTRDFKEAVLIEKVSKLSQKTDLNLSLVFFDCEEQILQRRYIETRRRHPLALDRPVIDGITHERHRLKKVLDRSDITIDTSRLNPKELKRILMGYFGLKDSPSLTIQVMSFSYRRGLPREADLVFDMRFLDNPHYVDSLRALTGIDQPIIDFISKDKNYKTFFDKLTDMIVPLIPEYQKEGKSYLTIGIGCTGGKHRSVFVAQQLGEWIEKNLNHSTMILHRDLDRLKARN